MSLPATTELSIAGMTCSHCARNVSDAAQSVPGVQSASVDVSAARASVRWRGGAEKNVAAVLAAISRAGYKAHELSEAAAQSRKSRWQWSLVLGLSVTGVLMIGGWGLGLSSVPWFSWLSGALAAVVQIFCGAQFYVGAWRQLKAWHSNMDTLVALGSSTAFGYSAWALLSGAAGHLYFLEAAAIISLISFGHWLEARVSEQAGSALKSLMHLAPQTGRRLRYPDDRGNQPPFSIHRPTSESARAEMGGETFNLKAISFSQPVAGRQRSEIEEEVPASELQIGDRVALRPGDRVPVDGLVVEGESAVDEAMLTGESVPVDKKPGGEVFAGTVNLNGRLVFRVTATGEATTLAHIIAAVQRAQSSRADIQRLGDRISSLFVPVIVVVALAAGLWWGLAPALAGRVHESLAPFLWNAHVPVGVAAGFMIAAAVLIIACPCAMGLATPAAIMASANAAARRGILIRDGVALEKAGSITIVIFDKTGTLTLGKPKVTDLWRPPGGTGAMPAEASQMQSGGKNDSPALPLAYALARHSTHPVSQAVAAYCKNSAGGHSPEIANDWREIRGCGIEARSASLDPQSPSVRLGSLSWLRETGVETEIGEGFINDAGSKGATIAGLAAGKELLALFAISDAVKPQSADVVARLQRQNLKTFLVTGDNSQTAIAIAREVGIPRENVFAEVRPEQKAELVKRLQNGGASASNSAPRNSHSALRARVAFVGDGINDAPALTQADLGIAVGRASDVAREAADIILLKSGIEAVPEALGLARATLRTIKQNLFWAFFYNALGVPLAALGFVSPIFCAAAMALSDLIVIGNALRLLRWKQPLKHKP